MFKSLAVPIDFSPPSLDALAVATKMAAQVGGWVDAITVVDHLTDVPAVRYDLTRCIERLGTQPVEVRPLVHASPTVVGAIAHHIEGNPGSMVLMSSHGRGRSAAVLGSTVDLLVRAMFGPVIVVGPQATGSGGDLGGSYVVPLDGSTRAEGVIPIVAAWSIEFHGTPWLVEVIEDPAQQAERDVVESSYVSNRASALRRRISRDVEFEILHGRDAGRSIVEFAKSQEASLIFMATHGRTGLARLAAGSVGADVIRHAPNPVVLFRPPELRQPGGGVSDPPAAA